MPTPVLHLGATVMCMHDGTALPMMPYARVLVSGQPVVQTDTPYGIVGCTQASVPASFCTMG